MADKALGILYNTVPHPPAALLGQEHAFRAADGKGNNLQDENYGRAGTGYARSVQPQFCVAPTSLPDPGLIFDTLLKRRGVSFISPFHFFFLCSRNNRTACGSPLWDLKLHICFRYLGHTFRLSDRPIGPD
jgi:hypothetical protein